MFPAAEQSGRIFPLSHSRRSTTHSSPHPEEMSATASKSNVAQSSNNLSEGIISNAAMEQFVGSCIYVNSFHHQSVKTPGRNVCVSARSPDGVIEAIELSGHPFALGVQWHPECMYRTSPEMRSLFHEFIAHSLINSKDSGHTIS